MKNFKGISAKSKAKDDFVELVTASSLPDLLDKVVELENNRGRIERIIPGQILIEKIEDKNLKAPVKIEVNEEDKTVIYVHQGKEII